MIETRKSCEHYDIKISIIILNQTSSNDIAADVMLGLFKNASIFFSHLVPTIMNSSSSQARQHLDQLFAIDAGFSFFFGVLALLAPHGILAQLSGGFYNHNVHETLRCVKMRTLSIVQQPPYRCSLRCVNAMLLTSLLAVVVGLMD
jgi:hypothetical protein